MGLYKRPIFCYNLNCSEENMALWCSRLARQPVTLEVDGSSPFGVANKKHHPSGWCFLFCETERTRRSKSNSPSFAKDGINEYRYIAYLLPTYWDFPQYNSI